MHVSEAAAAAGIVKQQAVGADRRRWDKRPSVSAGPENQYVAVGHHCSLCLTPVHHMENPLSYSAPHQHANGGGCVDSYWPVTLGMGERRRL